MIKVMPCPRCGVPPEKEFKFDRKNFARYHCNECGLVAGRIGGWVPEDVEYCAADVAAKNWNAAVKNELKKKAKEESGND